jgi:hypothetical protein
MFGYREGPEAGGLLSYGPDLNAAFRRCAVYVDKIIKGAQPSELPVEQASAFILTVNVKTAKASLRDDISALWAAFGKDRKEKSQDAGHGP